MAEHPLEEVWTVVADAATDEDTSGRLSYDQEGEPGLGHMAVTVQDERYVVEIYKLEED